MAHLLGVPGVHEYLRDHPLLLFRLVTQWSLPRIRTAQIEKLVCPVHPVVVQLQRLRLLLLLLDKVGTVEHVEVVDVEAG